MRRETSLIATWMGILIMLLCGGWFLIGFSADQPPLVDRCLRLSGIFDQLEALPQGIVFAIPEDAFPGKNAKAEVVGLLKRSEVKSVIFSSVRAAVEKGCDEATLTTVATFYESPVGKKVARVQRFSLAVNTLKELRESRTLLAELSPDRTETLRRILRASKTEEVNQRLLVSIISGLVDGYLAGKGHSEPKAENIRERLKAIENEIREGRVRTDEIALLAGAYSFRSIEQKELERLADYEESEPAQRFGTAVAQGFEQAVYEIGKTLGELTAKSFGPDENRLYAKPPRGSMSNGKTPERTEPSEPLHGAEGGN